MLFHLRELENMGIRSRQNVILLDDNSRVLNAWKIFIAGCVVTNF